MRVLYVGGRAQTHWVLSYCSSQIVSDVLEERVHKNVYVLQSIFINLSGLQTVSINTDRNGAELLGRACVTARGLCVCLWFSSAVCVRCVCVCELALVLQDIPQRPMPKRNWHGAGLEASGGLQEGCAPLLCLPFTHTHAFRHMR